MSIDNNYQNYNIKDKIKECLNKYDYYSLSCEFIYTEKGIKILDSDLKQLKYWIQEFAILIEKKFIIGNTYVFQIQFKEFSILHHVDPYETMIWSLSTYYYENQIYSIFNSENKDEKFYHIIVGIGRILLPDRFIPRIKSATSIC